MDETFVGGKVKNMHVRSGPNSERPELRAEAVKPVVMGMLERDGQVRATVVQTRTKPHIDPAVSAKFIPAHTSSPMSCGLYAPDQRTIIMRSSTTLKGMFVSRSTLRN